MDENNETLADVMVLHEQATDILLDAQKLNALGGEAAKISCTWLQNYEFGSESASEFFGVLLLFISLDSLEWALTLAPIGFIIAGIASSYYHMMRLTTFFAEKKYL